MVNNKITKPIYLGSGTSFNVSKYTGYQNFTVDNFIVCVLSASSNMHFYGYSTGHYFDESIGTGCPIGKSYNSNTGIFTVTGTYKSSTDHWEGGSKTSSMAVDVGVYLIANQEYLQ